jgi:hypothetical protein
LEGGDDTASNNGIQKRDTGLNEASRTYNVPKAILKRRVDGGNIDVVNHVQAYGRSTDLPKEIEDELSKYVLLLEERF